MFSLWGPDDKRNKNGKIPIVRIYLNGTGAYIWRRSYRHHKLEVDGGTYRSERHIQSFFSSLDIHLEKIRTRRELARILLEKGLLTADYQNYDIPETVNNTADKKAPTSSNIVNFADYKKK